MHVTCRFKLLFNYWNTYPRYHIKQLWLRSDKWRGPNAIYRTFHNFSVITYIYNKKTKGSTLMDLFTATGKLKKFFWQLAIFDVCTPGDTAHIDTIFKFLPHMRQQVCIDNLYCCNDPCLGDQVAIVGRTSSVSSQQKKKTSFSVFLWL
jgi:hypothetical protein